VLLPERNPGSTSPGPGCPGWVDGAQKRVYLVGKTQGGDRAGLKTTTGET